VVAVSKEMALRASDLFRKNDVELNVLQEYFLTIGMAKVSTSAYEAFDTRNFTKRKRHCCSKQRPSNCSSQTSCFANGRSRLYTTCSPKDIKVLGKQALGMFLVGTDQMEAGKYISEHDKKIANKLAYVMAGGDLSEPTLVSEQYLIRYRTRSIFDFVQKEKLWNEFSLC
jgi:3-hydroxyacyl-CoA dehydrogenase